MQVSIQAETVDVLGDVLRDVTGRGAAAPGDGHSREAVFGYACIALCDRVRQPILTAMNAGSTPAPGG